MTEPTSELPKGSDLVGYVVIATVVHSVERLNGQRCTVINWDGEDYYCRFDNGERWYVRPENVRAI